MVLKIILTASGRLSDHTDCTVRLHSSDTRRNIVGIACFGSARPAFMRSVLPVVAAFAVLELYLCVSPCVRPRVLLTVLQ